MLMLKKIPKNEEKKTQNKLLGKLSNNHYGHHYSYLRVFNQQSLLKVSSMWSYNYTTGQI